MQARNKIALVIRSLLLVVALAGFQQYSTIYTDLLRITGQGGIQAEGRLITLDADRDTSIQADTDDQIDIEVSGGDVASLTSTTLDVNALVLNQDLAIENIGAMPTIITATMPYTPASGTIATVGSGEIWIVHDVLVNVGTNFDCTGNDCVATIGDGNDPNGFIDLVDAEMQAADTEGTGFAAGWQGLSTGTRGVYLNEATTNGAHRFVYAGADTIDYAIGGTSPAAGSATVYVIYTRVQ